MESSSLSALAPAPAPPPPPPGSPLSALRGRLRAAADGHDARLLSSALARLADASLALASTSALPSSPPPSARLVAELVAAVRTAPHHAHAEKIFVYCELARAAAALEAARRREEEPAAFLAEAEAGAPLPTAPAPASASADAVADADADADADTSEDLPDPPFLLAVSALQRDCSDVRDARVRAAALRCFCALGADVAVHAPPLLDRAFSDPTPSVRTAAAIAVVRLVRSARRTRRRTRAGAGTPLFPLAPLRARLHAAAASDTDPSAAAAALGALDALWPSSVTPGLLARALNTLARADEAAQRVVVAVLGRHPPDPVRAADALYGALHALDPLLARTDAALVTAVARAFLALTRAPAPARVRRNALARVRNPLLMAWTTASPSSSGDGARAGALAALLSIAAEAPALLEAEHTAFFLSPDDAPHTVVAKLEMLRRIAAPSNAADIVRELEFATRVRRGAFRALALLCMADVAVAASSGGAGGGAQDAVCARVVATLLRTAVAGPPRARDAPTVCVAAARLLHRAPGTLSAQQVEEIVRAAADVPPPRVPASGTCTSSEPVPSQASAAPAAAAWLLGECNIPEATYRLEALCARFGAEGEATQLQLLTSCAKVFLRRRDEARPLLERILRAGEASRHPDVRDRARFLARALSAGPVHACRTLGVVQQTSIED